MAKTKLSKADIKKACDILRMDDGVGAGNYIEQLSWLLFLKVFENIEFELRELAKTEAKEYKDIIDTEYKWSTWAKKDWKDKDELVFFVNQKLFPYLRSLSGTPEKEKVAEIFREITNRIHSPHTLLDTVDILDSIRMEHFQDTHLLSQTYEEILQALGSEGGWSGEFYTPRPIIRLMIKVVNPKLGETTLDPFVGSAGFLVESFDHILSQNPKMGVKEWEQLQRKTFYGQEKKPLPFLIGMMNMILHRILVPNLIRTNTLMEDIHSMPENHKVDVILTNPPFGGKENQAVQSNFPITTQATEGLALQYVMRRLKNGGRCGIVLPEGQILFGGGAFQAIREELLQKFNVLAVISLPQGTFAQMGAGVKTNLVFFEKTGPTKEVWFAEVQGKYTKKKTIQDKDLEHVYTMFKDKTLSDLSWTASIEELSENNYDLTPKNPKQSEVIFRKPSEIADGIQTSVLKNSKYVSELFNFIIPKFSNNSVRKITLGDTKYFDLQAGSTPKTNIKEYWDNADILWVTPKDMGKLNSINITDSERKITQKGLNSCSTTLVPEGSIIISTRAPIGYVAIVGKGLCFNQGCKAVLLKNKDILPEFLYYAVLSSVNLMQKLGKGATFSEISKEKLKQIPIAIPFKDDKPDIETQRQIIVTLKSLNKLSKDIKEELGNQLTLLNALNQSVLRSYFKQD